MVQGGCAHGANVLVQDRMRKLDVLVHRLLHKVGVLLPSRLGDDMPYELLDPGVDVFLASARHGRIFAQFAGGDLWSRMQGDSDQEMRSKRGPSQERVIRRCSVQWCIFLPKWDGC